MAEGNNWKPEGDEEEEEELDETYKSAKDAVLFAIEVSPSMLEPADHGKQDEDSATSAALKCAYALMQQRIISNPNDMMGVLLYGTEKDKSQEHERSRSNISYPHCYLLTDLDIPAADDVKALRGLVEDGDEFNQLMVPSKEPVSMANVLFCANQIFTTKAPNFASRRLFIVTDNDDPHEANKVLRSAAAVRAKDLYDLGVVIELFPISRPGKDFDRAKFYNDIIYSASPSDPEAPLPLAGPPKAAASGDGITLLNSLLSSIKSRAVAKRALFANLPFEIGPGFKISVKGYIIFKRQETDRKSYIWLNGERAQIVESKSSKLADDTGRTVEKGEIRKAFKFGGEQVSFAPEEIERIRHFGDPGIRILGFKPLSMLPIWANIKPATFIYPSEEDFVGSTRVFSALQQKLLKDQKMALSWFVARKNAAPVIAAIIPGEEKLNSEGEQVIPPGMWLVPLPFVDDIRKNPQMMVVEAPDDLVNSMRKIVQQLQLPRAEYVPERYPNPALQWHYRILQALALDEEVPLKPDDKTVPKYRQINQRTESYVREWASELEAQYAAWQGANQGTKVLTKRPALSTKDENAPRKKGKTTDDNDGMTGDEEMRKHFDKDTVGKLTVAVLKAWLGGKGLETHNKKKAELVSAVEEYFESR